MRPTQVGAIIQGAPIALMVDMQTGQTLFARNEDRRFVPASITKVMTLFIAFEMIDAGTLKLDQTMTFSEAAAEDWERTGSTMFLKPGEVVPVDQLLRGIAGVSANDGSITLAEGALGSVEAWTDKMNVTARELGMRNSHFGTPNGWPDEGATFTTARDLEILARAMITRHPALYREYVGLPGLTHGGYTQANHDPISGVVKGADGIKTGFTSEAGNGFLGSAERDGTRLIMVVGGVDEMEARDEISRNFMEWGFSAFDRDTLFPRDARVGAARVQDGAQHTVPLVTASPVAVTYPTGGESRPVLTINYDGPVRAPVRKGEELAVLTVSSEGMPSATYRLLAAESVEKADALGRIRNAFYDWFSL